MSTLKEYTRAKHDEIENAPLSMAIMSGDISQTQWDLLVRQKAYVYAEIEKKLDMPDYVKLVSKVESDLNSQSRTLLVATHNYVKYLKELSEEQTVAHLYVHYLGEMFGGQVMKRKIPYENKTHMNFDNTAEAVGFIRGLISGKDELLKDEANNAFDLMLKIHDEIYKIAI